MVMHQGLMLTSIGIGMGVLVAALSVTSDAVGDNRQPVFARSGAW